MRRSVKNKGKIENKNKLSVIKYLENKVKKIIINILIKYIILI